MHVPDPLPPLTLRERTLENPAGGAKRGLRRSTARPPESQRRRRFEQRAHLGLGQHLTLAGRKFGQRRFRARDITAVFCKRKQAVILRRRKDDDLLSARRPCPAWLFPG